LFGITVLLAGPAAYAVDTMQTAYGGGDPAAGPQVAGLTGPGGFGNGRPFQGPTGGGRPPSGGPAGGQPPNGGPGGSFGGPSVATVDSSVVDYLAANRGSARWIVAVAPAEQAGSIELATGLPVLAIGGFSGTDPAPTLVQFQALVASGELRFVIAGGQGGGPGDNSESAARIAWIQATCRQVTDVSATLYDCAPAGVGS
jgi:hypothetical protein